MWLNISALALFLVRWVLRSSRCLERWKTGFQRLGLGGSRTTRFRSSPLRTMMTKFSLPFSRVKLPLMAFPEVAFSAMNTASDTLCRMPFRAAKSTRSFPMRWMKRPRRPLPLPTAHRSRFPRESFIVLTQRTDVSFPPSKLMSTVLEPACNPSAISMALRSGTCTDRNSSSSRSVILWSIAESSPRCSS